MIGIVRAAVALTLTFAVSAAVPAPVVRYDVTMTQRDLGGGAQRGTLELRIPTDGVVTGYFRDLDGAMRRTVTGGRHDARIWFDIGDLHVTGTLGNAGITAGAFSGADPTEYVFEAVPLPTP